MIRSFQAKLEAFYHISHSFVSEYDLNRVLQSITSEVMKLSNFDLISIYLLQGDQLSLKSVDGKLANQETPKTIPIHQTRIGNILQLKESILLQDLSTELQYNQELQLELGSIYIVPLIMNKQLIGSLLIGSKETHAFNPDDIKFFNILASTSTMAISNTINYNILRAYSRMATITARKNNEILDSYPQLVEELLHVFPFDGLKISIPHPFRNGELITFRIYSNNKILPFSKKTIPLKGSATEIVLKEKKPILFKGVHPFKTVLRFPVIVNGEALGVIHIYNKRENAYNKWEFEIISQLLLQIAPAVENIVQAVYKAELGKIKMIVKKLSHRLSYSSELETILIQHMNIAKRVFHYSDTQFWMLDQDRLTLRLLNESRSIELPITENSILTQCFLEKQTRVLHDIQFAEIHPDLTKTQGKSSLFIPICDENENQCVGVLVINDKNDTIQFSEEAVHVANQYIRPIGSHILKHFRKIQLEKS